MKKAVIWDLDGVIVDNAPYHQKAWQKTFQKRGIKYSEEDFRRNFGLRNEETIFNVLGQVSQEEINDIADEKEESFRQLIGQSIAPLPGAIELLGSLAEAKFQQALASSTPIENIRLLTRELKIVDYFQVIVAGEDVSKGKPDPQVFLLAAKKLGIEPKNCVVIEDAVAGVAAAKKAGMRCIAVTTNHTKDYLKEADIVVDTLERVTVIDLKRLLKGKYK